MERLIGKEIDGYRILEVIGQGGMGIVYKAIDISLDRVVALKMINPILAKDESFLRRFRTEARALARVENPHIVMVHGLRETEFGVFMVMEYVSAKTISEWLREKGAFTLEDTILICKQLLNALGYAHQVGVIHRDIKPSNIMLDKDLRVKVTDFGLAKLVRQHGPASTVTQMRAGTLYYMSPEQVKGLKNVDFRSDIYSLGMTIYEMITGRTPFDNNESDYTIQKMIVDGHIPSPLNYNATIPKAMVRLIAKAIDKDPQKRFQNAEEMLEQIHQIESYPAKIAEKEKRPKSYPDPKSILLVLSILVVLSLSYILLIDPYNFFNGKQPPPLPLATLNINSEPGGAEVLLNDSIIGRTPLRGIKALQGWVELSVMKSGFFSIDTTVYINPGEFSDYQFALRAQPPVQKSSSGFAVITSEPSGASVYIDNIFIGTTPTPSEGKELNPGRHSLELNKIGFVVHTEIFTIRSGETIRLRRELIAVPQKGKLTIKSQPPGAEILVEGKTIGTTPLENTEFNAGTYQLIIRKMGYEPFSSELTVESNEPKVVNANLKPIKGELKIIIRPWGSIYIDEVLKKKDTPAPLDTTLMEGYYHLKAVHPTLGKWEQQVKIEKKHPQKYDIDFNKEISFIVTSDPINAEIYVDGKPTGWYTPKEVKLRTGIHILSVRRSGYIMQGNDRIVNVYQDSLETFHFRLIKSP